MRRYVAHCKILYKKHILYNNNKVFFLRRFNLTRNPLKFLGKEVVSNMLGCTPVCGIDCTYYLFVCMYYEL